MADVLCTNNAIGCPSGATRPTSAHPTQTATSYTRATQNKQRLVNWQDNPNYSVITQAQARYEYNSQCKEQISFYISRMNMVGMREHNKTSTNSESTFSSVWGQMYLWKIFKGMMLVFWAFSLLTTNPEEKKKNKPTDPLHLPYLFCCIGYYQGPYLAFFRLPFTVIFLSDCW